MASAPQRPVVIRLPVREREQLRIIADHRGRGTTVDAMVAWLVHTWLGGPGRDQLLLAISCPGTGRHRCDAARAARALRVEQETRRRQPPELDGQLSIEDAART